MKSPSTCAPRATAEQVQTTSSQTIRGLRAIDDTAVAWFVEAIERWSRHTIKPLPFQDDAANQRSPSRTCSCKSQFMKVGSSQCFSYPHLLHYLYELGESVVVSRFLSPHLASPGMGPVAMAVKAKSKA
jgi:hypothetical protein